MSSMNLKDELHARFNPKYEFIPPVRVRGFKRENLAQLFGELGLKRGAEVGVAEGIYSKVLCESIPGLELTCCDLWAPYSTGTRLLKDQAMQNEALALAHEKLDKYGAKFIKAPSYEGAKQVQDGSLDFVYIDDNHEFDYVLLSLIAWVPKVKRGGIIAGHDLYRFRGAGVVEAVEAYTNAHQIHEWFVCDEREVSWFWVNDWR